MSWSVDIFQTATKRSGIFLFCLIVVCATPIAVAVSAETTSATFGGQTIVLPVPHNLCPIRKNETELEKTTFEFHQELQKSAGNKLLAFFADCVSIGKIRSGSQPSNFQNWVSVVGNLRKGREIVFPSISRQKYLEEMERNLTPDKTAKIIKEEKGKLNKAIRRASKKILGNEGGRGIDNNIVQIGILAVTDSIHQGFIIPRKSRTRKNWIGAIFGYTLIKGIPIYFYFYSKYENEGTIKNLLHNSEGYSAALIHLNK